MEIKTIKSSIPLDEITAEVLSDGLPSGHKILQEQLSRLRSLQAKISAYCQRVGIPEWLHLPAPNGGETIQRLTAECVYRTWVLRSYNDSVVV